MSKSRLKIAVSQFPVSADICENSRWIRRHMRRAKRKGAEIIHFSEAALSGYLSVHCKSRKSYDWRNLEAETEHICKLAKDLKLWVILGTAHYQGKKKPFNSLYLIDDRGAIIKRYDKCFCTPVDLKFYQSGRSLVTHRLGGIKFGLLICYDFRFPELYRKYLLKGCRLMFHSFYQVSKKPSRLMMQVSPAHIVSRAAENFIYVSANNTCDGFQWFNTRIQAPDGSILKECRWNRPGLLIAEIDLGKDKTFYNGPGRNAKRAARGYLYSIGGKVR